MNAETVLSMLGAFDVSHIAEAVRRIADLGGPVVLVLVGVSILTLSVVFYKLGQFLTLGVGRHRRMLQAVDAWDHGNATAALQSIKRSKSYLSPIIATALSPETATRERLDAEAEVQFARLERGFRLLDSVAQLAPLLGLFGTVLGMIDAFQALQAAGSQVDPSLLAGGIWVALLTTAAGLVVAMPTALILSWLEAKVEADRVTAHRAIETALAPRAVARG